MVLRTLIARNVSIILRTHPASIDYPGEIEIVKNLLVKINSPLIKLFIEKGTHKIEEELLNKNLYPEIYSLGGSATCELISQGIHSYSIGECQMPDSCQQFVVPIVSKIEECLIVATRTTAKPNELQMKDADSFLKLAKLTITGGRNSILTLKKLTLSFILKCKRQKLYFDRFLQDSIDSKLTSEYLCRSTVCDCTNLYFNEK